MPICSACGSDKANGEYSTNQRRKPDASRRCKACVGTPNNPNQQSGRQAPSANQQRGSGGTRAARPLGGAEGPAMEVDGSVMEGGGQVLRISTALASLLRRPVHVTKIRAGRSKPGLGNQHLAGTPAQPPQSTTDCLPCLPCLPFLPHGPFNVRLMAKLSGSAAGS